MATKKSTTKAKTKTTKRTTKKTSAAKSTAKKTQAKSVAAKKAAETPKDNSKTTTFRKIKSLHIISIGLFLALALAAGYFMTDNSYSVFIGYLAEDTIADKIAPASRAVFDIEIRWYLVGLLALSMLLPLFYITKMSSKYEKQVTKSRFVPWRWVDIGITGGLFTLVIALVSGIQNLFLLKLMADAIFIAALLGWVTEREKHGDNRSPKATYFIGLFAASLPWIILLISAIAGYVYGGTLAPWYVYALHVLAIVGGFIIFRNLYKEMGASTRVKNYLDVERSYLATNMLIKFALAAVLIVGLSDII